MVFIDLVERSNEQGEGTDRDLFLAGRFVDRPFLFWEIISIQGNFKYQEAQQLAPGMEWSPISVALPSRFSSSEFSEFEFSASVIFDFATGILKDGNPLVLLLLTSVLITNIMGSCLTIRHK